MLLRDTNDGSPYVIRTRVLSVDRRTTLVLYPNPAAYAYAKQRFGALQGAKWGTMEVHLRFCLNTKPMALMRATCHAWAAALPPPSEPDTPALLPALLPLESDLPPPPPPRDAAIVASSYAAAAATSNGGVGSKEFSELATLVPSDLAPLQPQLNDEQMGAVGAITAHAHGALPYVVYGPPGTGKTMTMIEAIMQVLLGHAPNHTPPPSHTPPHPAPFSSCRCYCTTRRRASWSARRPTRRRTRSPSGLSRCATRSTGATRIWSLPNG